MKEFVFDHLRPQRIGLPEAVFCAGKTIAQIQAIIDDATAHGRSLLLTRLTPDAHRQLQRPLDYDPLSQTAFFGALPEPETDTKVAIVTAGTSDLNVAREAARTLRFMGHCSDEYIDVGVAGLWRLLERIEELRRYPVIIAVAGMEGALFSVLGGLVSSVVIAVPTSTGYGVAANGETALRAALTSCAPGVLVTNIDNGYGAACAACRFLNSRSSA